MILSLKHGISDEFLALVGCLLSLAEWNVFTDNI